MKRVNLVIILKTSVLTILLLWKMFALNFLLDFEWLRFCSLFSEDRVCRAVHSSRFQWNLSRNCDDLKSIWSIVRPYNLLVCFFVLGFHTIVLGRSYDLWSVAIWNKIILVLKHTKSFFTAVFVQQWFFTVSFGQKSNI